MTSPVTSPKSPKRTLAMVRDHLRADEALIPRKRTLVTSALNTVAKACAMPLEAIPADPRFLNERLRDFAPAIIGVKESTWSNTQSLLRFALRHTGVMKSPPRRTQSFSAAWTALFKLPGRTPDLIGLSRLARFCSTHGIDPEQVNDQVFTDFLTDLETNQIVKNPRKLHRRAAQMWNGMANSTPGWPNELLTVPSFSKAYALPWDKLSISLKADIDAHLAQLDGSDPLSLLDVKPLKPSSLRTRQHQLHILASGMVLAGEAPERFKTLADVVQPEMVRKGLRFLLDRVGGTSKAQAHDVARTVVAVARHWVKLPEEQLAVLQGFAKRLDEPAAMTSKNRDRLRQFDDPEKVRKLLELPELLLKKARRREAGPNAADALLVQTALIIELLLMVPIRRHNMAALHMERHLVRNGDGKVYLMIDGAEVKNAVPVDAELFPHVVKLLDLYIKKYRPLLPGADSPWLFPGRDGSHKCRERIAQQVCEAAKTEAGIVVHMHLFRHISAKLYLDQNPGAYGVMQRVNGHKLLQTTVGIYASMETRASVKHYDQAILHLRNNLTRA